MPQDCHELADFPRRSDALPLRANAAKALDDYRARAARLRAVAVESPDAEVRVYLLTTAAQFDRLADYAAAAGSNPRGA